MKIIIRFLACLLALWAACQLFPAQAGYDSPLLLALAAVILTLCYIFLRPALQLLAIPFSLITCGLFVFIVNAGLVKLAAATTNGFWLHGFWLCVGVAAIIAILDKMLRKCLRIPKTPEELS